MVAAFAKENKLATLVGAETAGRLIPGSGFKIGFGYMLIMPKAAYITWHGSRFEGHGIDPDHAAGWSPYKFMNERDDVLLRAVELATFL
jgi:C-terminal processing protease CtpA/Prc